MALPQRYLACHAVIEHTDEAGYPTFLRMIQSSDIDSQECFVLFSKKVLNSSHQTSPFLGAKH